LEIPSTAQLQTLLDWKMMVFELTYLPISDFSQRTEFYPLERFDYDAERDVFSCPQGQVLALYKRSYSELEFVYRANAKICNACPVKIACTDSKTGRHLRRSFFQNYLERVQSYHKTEVYQKAMRKRQVWVESLFAEGKQWHGMSQFRLRGLLKVNIEALVRAAGQNIKRLLTVKSGKQPLSPLPLAASLPSLAFAA
jgi:hypothetical protein